MEAKFDVIIVGSGPAGVSAAFPLIKSGLRVLMLDGGRESTTKTVDVPYLQARRNDPEQARWMLGVDNYALRMRDAVSPKLRVPTQRHVFEAFGELNKVDAESFIALGSLAAGGLSNAWGCGVACLSEHELGAFPVAYAEMKQSYETVTLRMGVSGRSDDEMASYFGLDDWAQPPICLDELHSRIYRRHQLRGQRSSITGFRLGRSRVAALSVAIGDRQACSLSGNCLWGCSGRSLYSATDDIAALEKSANFHRESGLIVESLARSDMGWTVLGAYSRDGGTARFQAPRVLLAAGTLATTRLALAAIAYEGKVRVLNSPTAAFLAWIPTVLGTAVVPTFGLGQLSFAVSIGEGRHAFGSTFSTAGIPVAEFAAHVPLARRFGLDVLRGLLSSCVVGNVFLPGEFSATRAKLTTSGRLSVVGAHADGLGLAMADAKARVSAGLRANGAFVLPGSFKVAKAGADLHYAGTLPMRESPRLGETKPTGELHGAPGLYIVDGAALPALSEKSHTLTIMANADRIGRLLARGNRATS